MMSHIWNKLTLFISYFCITNYSNTLWPKIRIRTYHRPQVLGIRHSEVAWLGSSASGLLKGFSQRSAEAAGSTTPWMSDHSDLQGMEGLPRM